MKFLRANAVSVLLCAISLGALVVPLYLWWRAVRIRRRSELLVPDRATLARLDESRQLLQPEDAEEFSLALAEILRSYIGVRFKLLAVHQRTEEFLHDLLTQPNELFANHRASLADFLQRWDQAQFEHWMLSPEEGEALLASARNFVVQSSRPELRTSP